MDTEFLLKVGEHCEAVLSNTEKMLKERGMELRGKGINRAISREMCSEFLTGEEAAVLAGIMQARVTCG